MYERFTDRARKVMQYANHEAQRLNREYVGTEHILLGLIKEGSGVAANVLKGLGLTLDGLRSEVGKTVEPQADVNTEGALPHTPHAKKVIEHAIEEARGLNHNWVGTEHQLLGLIRQKEGAAARVLVNLNITADAVRQEILNMLGHGANAGGKAENSDRDVSPVKLLAHAIMGLTLWEYAELNKELLRLGVDMPGVHTTMHYTWTTTTTEDEPTAKGE